MSAKSFFGEQATTQVAAAIRDVEQRTCAELVVAVRARSGSYRHVDYLVGAVLAFAGLLIFIYHPAPFRIEVFPLEAAALFAAGALLSASLPPIRRVLSSSRLRAENVATAARAAFVELGVSETQRRQGVLVFVSTLERRVEVVADIGVRSAVPTAEWDAAAARLAQAVAPDPDLCRFLEALRGLGEVLSRALPLTQGDVNELPDEVRA